MYHLLTGSITRYNLNTGLYGYIRLKRERKEESNRNKESGAASKRQPRTKPETTQRAYTSAPAHIASALYHELYVVRGTCGSWGGIGAWRRSRGSYVGIAGRGAFGGG